MGFTICDIRVSYGVQILCKINIKIIKTIRREKLAYVAAVKVLDEP